MPKSMQIKSYQKRENEAFERVKVRVESICELASQLEVSLLIDAEETWIQKPIDDLTIAMMEKYNTTKVVVYYTFQMYCHTMLDHLKALHGEAEKGAYILGAKLVRGAYMEKESARAAEMNYTDPIQPDKASTDRDYNAASLYCIENLRGISLFAGTHNEDSNYKLTVLMDEFGL